MTRDFPNKDDNNNTITNNVSGGAGDTSTTEASSETDPRPDNSLLRRGEAVYIVEDTPFTLLAKANGRIRNPLISLEPGTMVVLESAREVELVQGGTFINGGTADPIECYIVDPFEIDLDVGAEILQFGSKAVTTAPYTVKVTTASENLTKSLDLTHHGISKAKCMFLATCQTKMDAELETGKKIKIKAKSLFYINMLDQKIHNGANLITPENGEVPVFARTADIAFRSYTE